MNLLSSVSEIKGVGPKLADQFKAAGLHTVFDLINNLPRCYEDYSGASRIADLVPGKVTLRARAVDVKSRHIRGNLTIIKAVLEDNDGTQINAVWFNQPYRVNQLKSGKEFVFAGNFELKYGRYQLTAPSCALASDLPVESDQIRPVYSMCHGLKPSVIYKVMEQIRPLLEFVPEDLPNEVVTSQGLCSRAWALRQVHFPSSRNNLVAARRRLGFEEVFAVSLAAKLNRSTNMHLESFVIKFDQAKIKALLKRLPFQLTLAQKRSLWEIIQDFERQHPMNRLLQGDVGSGKTVVAALAAYQALLGGYQVAVMVPTEVLVAQHTATFRNLLGDLGAKICELTGSTKGEQREQTLSSIATGDAQIVIGTHALFQPEVKFRRLGFVVIDEQHRFGVKQRQDLLAKTDEKHLPHLLAMTATPIPRSLQLTVFGDLDVSVIDQLPSGRQVIKSKIILPNERLDMVNKIKQELANGRQVYYVTPLVEDSTMSEKQSAESLYKEVAKIYSGYRVGILHGKMKPSAKDDAMFKFKQHETDILVATTVIEVGVDVPNATVMVIEDADSFGLAQLHQLRGRVGRGQYASYCFLCQRDTKQPSRRLREVERSNDGFHLAQVDLEMRGAGEIYGVMQHGETNLKIADLADTKLIHDAASSANEIAARIVADDKYLDNYRELAHIIKRYQKVTTLN